MQAYLVSEPSLPPAPDGGRCAGMWRGTGRKSVTPVTLRSNRTKVPKIRNSNVLSVTWQLAPRRTRKSTCLICDGDRPVVAIAACYVGPADRVEATVAPLRKWGTVVADQLQPMSYVQLQSLFDAARPAGCRCAMRSNFMAALPDAAIEILVEGFRTTPSPLSAVIVEHCHGAIARVAPDATAFGLRSN